MGVHYDLPPFLLAQLSQVAQERNIIVKRTKWAAEFTAQQQQRRASDLMLIAETLTPAK